MDVADMTPRTMKTAMLALLLMISAMGSSCDNFASCEERNLYFFSISVLVRRCLYTYYTYKKEALKQIIIL
jgi:hypothetical protein